MNVCKNSYVAFLTAGLFTLGVFFCMFPRIIFGEEFLVATVNLYDAEIVSQDNHKFILSFDLHNRTEIQPDIHYFVQLASDDDKYHVVDQEVYADSIVLNTDQTIQKEIIYTASDSLDGDYALFIGAKTKSGLLLSLVPLGTVNLTKNDESDYLFIDSSSCFLTIDSSTEKYDKSKMLEIQRDQQIFVSCTIENTSKSDIVFKPRISTYARTIVDEPVVTNKEFQTSERMISGQKKQFSFSIPLVEKPQNYNTELVLLNELGQENSNSVSLNYIVRGESATVENVRLDKNYFKSGDSARVSFYWTAHDDFNKKFAHVLLRDFDDNDCIVPFVQVLDTQNIAPDFNVQILRDCVNPVVTVNIADESGNTFDTSELSIISTDIPPVQPTTTEVQNSSSNKYALYLIPAIFIILLLCVATIFYFRKRNVLPIFLLFIMGGFFSDVPLVKADTVAFSLGNPAQAAHWNNGGLCTGSFTFGTSKATYNTMDSSVTMNASLSALGWACVDFSASVYADSNFFDTRSLIDLSMYQRTMGGIATNGSSNFSIGSFTLGSHTARFSLSVRASDNLINYTQSWSPNTLFSVVQNGVCYAGGYYCDTSSALCTISNTSEADCYPGTRSVVVSDSTKYTWTCAGSGGGSTASCSAWKPDAACGASSGTTVASAPSSNLCSGGTSSSVTWYESGNYWYWTCTGAHNSLNCSASKAVTPVCGNGTQEGVESCDLGASNGSCPSTCSSSCTVNSCFAAGTCGPAATSYTAGASSYSGAYCSSAYGSSATPAFPSQGLTTNWYCLNSLGSNDAYCTASRATVAPTGLIANTGACGGSNNLSWNAVTNASSYSIYYSSGVWIANTGGTSYTHTGSLSTSYTYYVRANNSAGLQSTNSSTATAVSSAACAASPNLTTTNTSPAVSASFTNPASIIFTGTANNSLAVTPAGQNIWGDVEIDWNQSNCAIASPDYVQNAGGPWSSVAIGWSQGLSAQLNASNDDLRNGTYCYRMITDRGGLVTESNEGDNGATPWRTGSISGLPACSDGIDNDSDGLIGFPNDPGCTDDSDTDETDPVNVLPTTVINLPSTQTITQGTTVNFDATGTDTDGSITSREWRDGSCVAGALLSSLATFSNNTLSLGAHTIYFRVRDNLGAWSTDCPSRVITVINPQCNDGIDNDTDGKIDYGGGNPDPGCSTIADNDEADSAQPPVITINGKTNNILMINPGDTVTVGWDTNNGDETTCTLMTSTNPDNIGNISMTLPGGGDPENGTQGTAQIIVRTKFTLTCPGFSDSATVEPISGPKES